MGQAKWGIEVILDKGEEVGAWGFNKKEDNSQKEWKEQMLGKQMFAGPSINNGT